MKLFRLARARHAKDLDGVGAKLYPGRWNSLDVPMIYCAESIAQCVVEVVVHHEESPDDYCAVELTVPDNAPVLKPSVAKLPKSWMDEDYNPATRAVGDAFIGGKYLLMRVPSATVEGAYNYLINPAHPDLKQVKVVSVKPFTFDKRLFKKK